MKRRKFVEYLSIAGAAGLVGCSGIDDGENQDQVGELTVTLTRRVDRELTVDVAILEPNQLYEEGIVWRVTMGVNQDSIEIVEDDLTASEYRIVVRSEGYEDYERTWNLDECLELGLTVEVREQGFDETGRICRRTR